MATAALMKLLSWVNSVVFGLILAYILWIGKGRPLTPYVAMRVQCAWKPVYLIILLNFRRWTSKAPVWINSKTVTSMLLSAKAIDLALSSLYDLYRKLAIKSICYSLSSIRLFCKQPIIIYKTLKFPYGYLILSMSLSMISLKMDYSLRQRNCALARYIIAGSSKAAFLSFPRKISLKWSMQIR